jgi:polysaccharide chain length determinant protein (PEP-CTERM system associated)
MNPPETFGQAEQAGGDFAREYLLILSRNKWIISGFIAVSLAMAWAYCLIATKYYQSETLIIAEDRKGIQGVTANDDLRENFDQRLFLIQRQIKNQDFLGEIAREFNLYEAGLDQEGEAAAFAELLKNTQVQRVKTDEVGNFSGRSLVEAFTVSFMHQVPGTAMQVTAAIADRFIEDNTREREREVEGAAEFLDAELRWMKVELEKKEEVISSFKKGRMGELPQQTDSNLRALDRTQGEITASTESLQRHSDKLLMLEKALYEYRTSGQRSSAFMIPRTMEPDPLFRKLRELKEKLVILQGEFLDSYPEVGLTREEIKKVEKELTQAYGPDAINPGNSSHDPYIQELEKLKSDEQSEIALLKKRLNVLHAAKKDLESRLERTPQVEQELLVLERDYTNMKANYAMLLDKRLNTRVAENMEKRQQGGKFRILDHANFPRKPVIPNMPRVLVLGLLFGCVFGAGVSVLRERLTPQFRGPEDVELLLSGPRLLASIPDFSSLWRAGKHWSNRENPYLPERPVSMTSRPRSELIQRGQPGGNLTNSREVDERFVAKLFPRSMVAEQYRVAAARLQLINATGAALVATVTSAIKGEGKTTTIVNLGYTLAKDFNKRVLLLDCDFVYPELRRFMEISVNGGLIDCLKGNSSLEEAMSAFTDVPCWIMPAGEAVDESTELLKAGQLDRVLSHLREQFDYILLNAPPILPVATMNVLERHSDLLLLVVRANVTSKQAVTQALGSLRASRPIHVILNGVAPNALPSYMADYSVLSSRARSTEIGIH